MLAEPLLERLPLDANSDDFVFDNEVLAETAWLGAQIGEVSCPTSYAADASSIDSSAGRVPVSEFLKSFTEMTKDMKLTSWDMVDPKVTWLGADAAIITYKWVGRGTYQGKPIPSPVWSSTVWSKRGDKWLAVFHQESPAVEAAPAKK